MWDSMLETKCIIFICYIKCFEIIFQKRVLKILSWPSSFLDCTSHVSLYLPICVLLLESTHYFCVSCVKIAFVMVVENPHLITEMWSVIQNEIHFYVVSL
jgi:hypothetical protein